MLARPAAAGTCRESKRKDRPSTRVSSEASTEDPLARSETFPGGSSLPKTAGADGGGGRLIPSLAISVSSAEKSHAVLSDTDGGSTGSAK